MTKIPTDEERLTRYERHKNDGGWIGVDLDGTLAEYHTWGAALEFGKPIPRMVDRIKKWLEMGMDVRIVTARMPLPGDFTARLCDVTGKAWGGYEMREAIADWTEKHVGKRLEAQCYKDLHMLELWDDRAVQVVANTGRTIAEVLAHQLMWGTDAEKVAEDSALSGGP